MHTLVQLNTLFRYRMISVRNGLKQLPRHSRLKVATIFGLSIFLWMFIFRVAWLGFVWIESQNEIVADLVTGFVFDIFFFCLGTMLFVSNLVMGYGSLFAAPETVFLTSTPLNRRAVFLFKGLESLAFSSWSVLALGLPLFLAFGLTHEPPVSAWFYPLSGLAVLAFIVLVAGAGQTVNLLIAALFPRNRKGVLVVVLLVAAAVAGAWGMENLSAYRSLIPNSERWAGRIFQQFAFLRHFMLPTHWMTVAVLQAAQGELRGALFSLGLVGSTAALALYTFHACGVYLYGRACDRVRASAGGRGGRGSVLPQVLSRLFGPQDGAILSKDMLYFIRDPAQWLQFVILLGLLLFYFLNLRTVGYDTQRLPLRHIIASLNLFSVTMVLATLSTRFFFPLISLEGNRFWVLGLAPVSRGQLLRAKFRFALVCNIVLAEGMLGISNLMLGMGGWFALYQFGVALCAALALSAMAVGLGAVFPDYRAGTPAKAVSGFGGTLCMILSIGYVVVLVVCAITPPFLLRRYEQSPERFGLFLTAGGSLAALVLITMLVVWWSLRSGAKALSEAEL